MALNEKGFSLVELLAAAVLIALVGALSYPALKFMLNLQRTQTERNAIRDRIARVESVITRAGEHSRSIVSFPSVALGISSEYSALPPKHRPAAGSAILRFVRVNHRAVLEVVQWQPKLTGCFHGTLTRPATEIRRWLAINIDRPEPIATSVEPAAVSGCTRGYQGEASSAFPIRLFPIEDEFSLYLDRDATFRRYSHITAQSQPIARGIDTFDVVRASSAAKSIFLTLRVGASGTKGATFEREVIVEVREDAANMPELAA